MDNIVHISNSPNINVISADGISSKTSEVEHFGAVKEKKNSVTEGIELFNKDPLKGLSFLIDSGILQNNPESIAIFIRKHKDSFDKTMIGEYLGYCDEMSLKVMHSYIDKEIYKKLTIDMALRKLLSGFIIPRL